MVQPSNDRENCSGKHPNRHSDQISRPGDGDCRAAEVFVSGIGFCRAPIVRLTDVGYCAYKKL